MAGAHRYSSSLFIQSGSIAQFKNGISSSGLDISGTVIADNYLLSDGSSINTSRFFAGSGSGISESSPKSQDTFIQLVAGENTDPEDSNKLAVGQAIIETTGSSTFKPNFYNFLKVGNLDSNIVTVQQSLSDQPNYLLESIEERSGGVHKYIIYAAETGSSGETQQVFHTITIATFVNQAPTLLPPENTNFILPIEHDRDTAQLIVHFTESFDANQLSNQGGDFLKQFTASRNFTNVEIGDSDFLNNGYQSYNITLNHTDTNQVTLNGINSIVIESLTTPGFGEGDASQSLHFTASLNNYTAIDASNNNLISSRVNQAELYRVTLKDNYEDNEETPGVVGQNYTITVTPPPTASIQDIRVQFEGTDNNGGYSGDSLSDTHTHTVLYDFTGSLKSSSIAAFHADNKTRYTSSIVRAKALATITKPDGFPTDPNFFTDIEIQSGSDDFLFNLIGSDSPKALGFFRFRGNDNINVSASLSSSAIDGTYNSLEKDNFFSIEEELANNTSRTDIRYGTDIILGALNNIERVRHGNHNHYEVLNALTPTTRLTINKCPDILIEDIKVEVESGSFSPQNSHDGHPNLTSSLLYGLTSSILSEDTESLFGNFIETDNYHNLISQSIVRLRLKAKITEPFGPTHNTITANIESIGGGAGETHVIAPTFNGVSSLNDTDPFNILRGNDNIAREGTLNLSNILNNPSITTIDIINIELAGELSGSAANDEYLENFTVGGVNIGNLRMSGSGDKVSVPNSVPAILDKGNFQFEEIEYPITVNVGTTNPGEIDVQYTSVGAQYRMLDENNGNVSTSGNSSARIDQYSFSVRITFEEPDTQTEPTNITFNFNTSSAANNGFEHTTNHNHTDPSQANKELLVSQYTSSFVEIKVPQSPQGGIEYIATFSSSSNAGTTLDTSNIQSAIISMSAAPPTRYENIRYETETFGYSDILTDSTFRTVLFGQNATNDGTGSGESLENFANHPQSASYVSHSVARFKIKASIVEPFGIALSDHSFALKTKDQFNTLRNLGAQAIPIVNTLNPSTGIVTTTSDDLIETINTTYNNLGELVTSFTSSYIGFISHPNIHFPDTYTVTSSISTTFDNNVESNANNGVIIEDPLAIAQLKVNDVAPTQIINVRYETETGGHTNEATTDSFRRVLYGDNRTTNADDSSYSGHPSASKFTSHSVSRFRVKADIIEPIGPLHEPLDLNRVWEHTQVRAAGNYPAPERNTFSEAVTTRDSSFDVTDTITFTTGSSEHPLTGFETPTTNFGPSSHRTSSYTSSFIGKALTINSSNGALYSASYNFTGSWSGFSNITTGHANSSIITDDNTTMLVIDTAPTIVKFKDIDIETFGESGEAADKNILSAASNPPDTHTRKILANEITTRSTGSSLPDNDNLTGSAVLRTQMKIEIIEPLGPLHFNESRINHRFDPVAAGTNQNSPQITFTSESNFSGSVTKLPSSNLITHDQTHEYTTIFTGSEITAIEGNNPHYFLAAVNNNIDYNPSDENKFDLDNSLGLNFIAVLPSSSNFNISNFQIRVEENNSGSNDYDDTFTNIRTTNILHGNSGSETNPTINLGYPDLDDQQQLVSVKIRASIQEPLAQEHLSTIFKIGGNDNITTVVFNTESNNPDVGSFSQENNDNGLLVHYTSSAIPLLFNAEGAKHFEGPGGVLTGIEVASTNANDWNNLPGTAITPPNNSTSEYTAGDVLNFEIDFNTSPTANNDVAAGTIVRSKVDSDPYIAPAGATNLFGIVGNLTFPEIQAATGGGGTIFPNSKLNDSVRRAYFNNARNQNLSPEDHGMTKDGEPYEIPNIVGDQTFLDVPSTEEVEAEVDVGTVDGENTALHNFTGYVKLKKIELSGDLDGASSVQETLSKLRIGIEDIDGTSVSDTNCSIGSVSILNRLTTAAAVLTEVWNSDGPVPNPITNGHRIVDGFDNDRLNTSFHFNEVPVRNGKILCNVKHGIAIATGPGGGHGVRIVLTVETLDAQTRSQLEPPPLAGFTGFVNIKTIEFSGDLARSAVGVLDNNPGGIRSMWIGTQDISFEPTETHTTNQLKFGIGTPAEFDPFKFVGEDFTAGAQSKWTEVLNNPFILTTVFDSSSLSGPNARTGLVHGSSDSNANNIYPDFNCNNIPITDGKIVGLFVTDTRINKNIGINMRLTVEKVITPVFSLTDIELLEAETKNYVVSASVSNTFSEVNSVSSDIFEITPLSNTNTHDVIWTTHDGETYDSLIKQENVLVAVTGALESTIVSHISSTGSFGYYSSSLFNPSDTEESIYYVYPSGNVEGYVNDTSPLIELHAFNTVVTPPTFTSESVLEFPNNLFISYSSSFAGYENANQAPATGTGSFQLNNPNSYGNVISHSNVIMEIYDRETGSGYFATQQTIHIIPAIPKIFSGEFAHFTASNHPDPMKHQLYTGTLTSQSLIHYSESIGPLNDPNVNNRIEVSSSRILFTSKSDGSHDYSLILNTHDNAVYTGSYADDIPFMFGDTGSLELKINGETKATYNLESNFSLSDKNGSQDIPSRADNGTASFTEGRLIINNTAPLNGISQSLSASGFIFPNGFQAFDAKIELDSKIRDGFNSLELIHNIYPSLTQSLTPFEWYYNDGIESASIKVGESMSWAYTSDNNTATHSLSGVSYFKEDNKITASINEIYNLANKVYPNNAEIMFTQKTSTNLLVTGDGNNLDGGTSGKLFHRINDLQGTFNAYDDTFRRGLRFDGNDNIFIPSASSTGSITFEVEATALTAASSIDVIKGQTFGLRQFVRQRDKDTTNSYNDRQISDLKIGRWMHFGSNLHNFVASDDFKVTFFDEDKRWSSASIGNFHNLDPGDVSMGGVSQNYTFWLSSSRTDYDSAASLISGDYGTQLQQIYSGKLRYPTESYTEVTNPNTVDYSSTSLPYTIGTSAYRYYYAALQVPNFNDATKKFRIKVTGNFNISDIYGQSSAAGNPTSNLGIDDSPIRIDFKQPGPQDGETGTGWSNAFFKKNTGNINNDDWGSYESTVGGTNPPTLNGTENGNITAQISVGTRFIANTNGVILIRVRFKSPYDVNSGYSQATPTDTFIKEIKLEEAILS